MVNRVSIRMTSVPMAEIYTDPKSAVGVLVANKWSVWNNPLSGNLHTYLKV